MVTAFLPAVGARLPMKSVRLGFEWGPGGSLPAGTVLSRTFASSGLLGPDCRQAALSFTWPNFVALAVLPIRRRRLLRAPAVP